MEESSIEEPPMKNHHPQHECVFGNDDDENDWNFQEFPPESPSECNRLKTADQMVSFPPPQLHPAVSMGMHKVSSCYFSIGSHDESSMADLLSSKQQQPQDDIDFDMSSSEDDGDNASIQFTDSSQQKDDILYHDILMNVFTYLDAQSLASFSETARRPNFEVFYFLQLQLQRSLLVDLVSPSLPSSSDQLTAIAGSAILSRLAKQDPPRAQAIVDDYLQSNSTLRRMPLSHSIAYMRHFLQRQGFLHQHFPEGTPSQAFASAALLATLVGAAYMTGEMPQALSSGELPNLLFRFGFVGSLMGAARQMSDGDVVSSSISNKTKEEKKEQEEETKEAIKPATTPQFRFPSLFEMKETLAATLRDSNANNNNIHSKSSTTKGEEPKPMLSNPYDHHEDEKEEEDKVVVDEKTENKEPPRKMPSGCMGAYSRAIQSATASIVEIVKHGRQTRFAALRIDEQSRNVERLLEACSLNEGLPTVKELSHTMDLDAFYVGSDGSETCALHTAAFHGASEVVDYLLQGIDDSDPEKDGGLCLVDCRDSNGWAALHFAAGSNSVESVQELAKHGAKLSLEANNGYSPLQWARRLSNDEVEEALTELLKNELNQGWRARPLTHLANRFFSLIPSR